MTIVVIHYKSNWIATNWNESSTGVITSNMVASFLPAFCLLLVVGGAIAGKDEIPEEMVEKLKAIHEVCVNEGHDARKYVGFAFFQI